MMNKPTHKRKALRELLKGNYNEAMNLLKGETAHTLKAFRIIGLSNQGKEVRYTQNGKLLTDEEFIKRSNEGMNSYTIIPASMRMNKDLDN